MLFEICIAFFGWLLNPRVPFLFIVAWHIFPYHINLFVSVFVSVSVSSVSVNYRFNVYTLQSTDNSRPKVNSHTAQGDYKSLNLSMTISSKK